MTKAEIQLQDVSKNQHIKSLIDRLDLILIPDHQSAAISARVQQLIDVFASRLNSAQEERYIISDSSTSFFDPKRVERHLLAFYGPRPWSYPLTKTPF